MLGGIPYVLVYHTSMSMYSRSTAGFGLHPELERVVCHEPFINIHGITAG
jgi:hypothetical protein